MAVRYLARAGVYGSGVGRLLLPGVLALAVTVSQARADEGAVSLRDSVTWEAPSGMHHNITFTFAEPVPAFRFANGDWGVQGPVTLVSITPEVGKGLHGWMINPGDPGKQSFDHRGPVYTAALLPPLPYTAEGNQSIAKVVSLPQAKRAFTAFSAVLTVLDRIPESPGSTFRPPYAGREKPLYSTLDLREELLPSLEAVPHAPSRAHAERRLRHVRLDYLNHYLPEAIIATDAGGAYAADMFRGDMPVYFWLCLDQPPEEKRQALIHAVQLGIDLFGCFENGTSWSRGGGGLGQGRAIQLVFAAAMLGDERMREKLRQAKSNRFLETVQIARSDVHGLVLWGQASEAWNGYGEHYWNYLVGAPRGSKDCADPAGWIDGGEQPAGSYHAVTYGGYKYTALLLTLIPELQSYWPDPDLKIVEYGYRMGLHGAWTLPDPYTKRRPPRGEAGVRGPSRFPHKHGAIPSGGAERSSACGEAMFRRHRDPAIVTRVEEAMKAARARAEKRLQALPPMPDASQP